MQTLPSKTIYTVKEAAERFGKTTGRIRQICQKKKLGSEVHPNLRLLSAADLAWLETYFAESGHRFEKVT